MKRPRVFNLDINIWSGSVDGSDKESASKSLEETIQTNKIRTAVFNTPNIVFTIVAIIIALIAIPVLRANQIVGLAMFGAALVCIIVVVVIALANMAKYPKQIEKAISILDDCFEEINKYNNEYDKYDSLGVSVSRFIFNYNFSN